jgi:hypothetical protein
MELDRLEYFKGLEHFIAAFYRTQEGFQNAEALVAKGDLADARAMIAPCRPAQVIEQFARFSSVGGMTRGEEGLVVSLNLRWLPHFVRLRQILGLEPVRYNFGPTSHDKLAQQRGMYTFHFDARHQVWQTLGAEETGAEEFVVPADASVTHAENTPAACEEICRRGIEGERPITLALRPILRGGALRPGEYRLRLAWLDPSSSAPGQRVFTVSVEGRRSVSPGSETAVDLLDTVDVFRAVGRPNCALERTYRLVLAAPGEARVTLTPRVGKAIISAAVLEPAN